MRGSAGCDADRGFVAGGEKTADRFGQQFIGQIKRRTDAQLTYVAFFNAVPVAAA